MPPEKYKLDFEREVYLRNVNNGLVMVALICVFEAAVAIYYVSVFFLYLSLRRLKGSQITNLAKRIETSVMISLLFF